LAVLLAVYLGERKFMILVPEQARNGFLRIDRGIIIVTNVEFDNNNLVAVDVIVEFKLTPLIIDDDY